MRTRNDDQWKYWKQLDPAGQNFMENEHWIVAAYLWGCLWSLHWLKDHWWEQQGALFSRIHSCLNILSTPLAASLLYCVFSPGFHFSPLYTGVPAFLLDLRILHSSSLIQPDIDTPPPATLQSGWLRYRVPLRLGWPGVGMNPTLWPAWGSV